MVDDRGEQGQAPQEDTDHGTSSRPDLRGEPEARLVDVRGKGEPQVAHQPRVGVEDEEDAQEQVERSKCPVCSA